MAVGILGNGEMCGRHGDASLVVFGAEVGVTAEKSKPDSRIGNCVAADCSRAYQRD